MWLIRTSVLYISEKAWKSHSDGSHTCFIEGFLSGEWLDERIYVPEISSPFCGVCATQCTVSMPFDLGWTCTTYQESGSSWICSCKWHNDVVLATTHETPPLASGCRFLQATADDRYIDCWLKSHPGCIFSEYQVGEAFTEAYGKAGSIETITNSFRSVGFGLWTEMCFPMQIMHLH